VVDRGILESPVGGPQRGRARDAGQVRDSSGEVGVPRFLRARSGALFTLRARIDS